MVLKSNNVGFTARVVKVTHKPHLNRECPMGNPVALAILDDSEIRAVKVDAFGINLIYRGTKWHISTPTVVRQYLSGQFQNDFEFELTCEPHYVR